MPILRFDREGRQPIMFAYTIDRTESSPAIPNFQPRIFDIQYGPDGVTIIVDPKDFVNHHVQGANVQITIRKSDNNLQIVFPHPGVGIKFPECRSSINYYPDIQ